MRNNNLNSNQINPIKPTGCLIAREDFKGIRV